MTLKMSLQFIIILLLLVLFDIPVILYINNSIYEKQFLKINKDIINIGYHTFVAAIISYLLLTVGIYYYIMKPELNNNKSNYLMILLNGMILGFIIYGVYNSTNMATINEWGIKESIIDTLWGAVLVGVISSLSVYISKMII